MSSPPRFTQVNLVVDDMAAAVAFYRLLGFDVPDPVEWPEGSGAYHVDAGGGDGLRFELDNLAMARIWHAGVKPEPAGGTAVIGLALESRDAVDQLYATVIEAGHAGPQPPYDAFWGARYAVVQDPDGYEIGLMSPIDQDDRYVPEV
jgi:uncharacterized glyoxalase superfamily protein PhnB